MLSCRLTTPLCRPKHVISSSRCGSSLSSCYSRPRLPSQTRAIFGSVKSRLKRWLGPERERIPLVTSGSAVLFSENNLWARAGPSEGSILIGLTEEAKDLLRPLGEMELWERFGEYLAPDIPIGCIRFYHPDDIEHNRISREILQWKLKMPLAGTLKSVNPLAASRPILTSDPHFNDWLFFIEDVLERDWNALMTAKEYEDHVRKTSNLLDMEWKPSLYSSPWFEVKTSYKKRAKPPTAKEQVQELLRAQKERESQK